MCGCGPSVDTYGATLNVHDFVQCYAIEGLLVTPRVCRIYRRFTLLLLVLPQTTVFGATLNAKLRGGTLNAQWPLFLPVQIRPRWGPTYEARITLTHLYLRCFETLGGSPRWGAT